MTTLQRSVLNLLGSTLLFILMSAVYTLLFLFTVGLLERHGMLSSFKTQGGVPPPFSSFQWGLVLQLLASAFAFMFVWGNRKFPRVQ